MTLRSGRFRRARGLNPTAGATGIGPSGSLESETMNRAIALWAPFVVISLVTVAVYAVAWAMPGYWITLSCLALASLILAVRVLRGTGVRLWPTVGVVVGLAIGQWWLLTAAFAMVIWSIRGFAP